MNRTIMCHICWPAFLTSLLIVGAASSPSWAAFLASLSLEPNPSVSAAPGETVDFDVRLLYTATDGDGIYPVISFKLDVNASDPALTGAGADFSAFDFVLNSQLVDNDIIGSVVFQGDIQEFGFVEYGASLFGDETGIFSSMGELSLGILSVTAPAGPGFYGVALAVNSLFPAFATNLLIDDLVFSTLPGSGELTITNSAIEVSSAVIPESGGLVVWGVLLGVACAAGSWRRRLCPARMVRAA